MNKQIFSHELFAKVPVIGIIRGMETATVIQIVPFYISAGLTTIEITMNTKSAGEIIHFIGEQYCGRINVGAGTVCNMEDLKSALSSGAQFIVTPVLCEEVIIECVRRNIPVFPGALTPTEIYRAWELGATMVKVYPATYFGAAYIKDVKAPLNKIKLLPTGGVDKDNMDSFVKAGADGLGIGSKLFDREYIRSERWEDLKNHFEFFAGYFKKLRKGI